MGRISWNNSRTKASNEKTTLERSQEWFSVGNGESSRHALSDLVRRHRGNYSGATAGSKSSKLPTTGRTSPAPATSRPTLSPDHTRPPTSFRQHGRPVTPTRNLLDRSAQIIRRTGSRMSMSSTGSVSTVGPPGHVRSSQSSLSEMKSGNLHAYISKPYDFHHITHAERAQVHDLITSGSTELSSSNLLPSAGSPSSPPAPVPLAKDSPPQLPLPSSHLSRMASSSSMFNKWQGSLEVELNKPLPTPKLMDSPFPPTPVEARPLPPLPVVHAVSTSDDTARPLMTSPLPTPPPFRATFEEPKGPTQQHNAVRDFHKPTGKTSTAIPATFNNRATIDCVAVTPQSVSPVPPSTNSSAGAASRLTTGLSVIDSMNWEEVIDEAWDYVSDQEDLQTLPTSSVSSWQSSPVEPHGPSSTAGTSMASTPVSAPALSKLEHAPLGETLKPVAYSPCMGLGIEAQTDSSLASTTDRTESADCTVTRTNSHASHGQSSNSSVLGTERSSTSSLALMLPMMCVDTGTHTNVAVRARPESGCLPVDILAEMSSGPLFVATDERRRGKNVPTVPTHQPQQRQSACLPCSSSSISSPGTAVRKRSNTYHTCL